MDLEGKTVGLYFTVISDRLATDFNLKLLEVYEKLKERGQNFEIVVISLDNGEEQFKRVFATMPWLALPFKDRSYEKLERYFEVRDLPTLVIIGPDGKTLSPNAAEFIEDHGIKAYPFNPEKLVEFAEMKRAKLGAQTLESILVSEELDFVIAADGSKVKSFIPSLVFQFKQYLWKF